MALYVKITSPRVWASGDYSDNDTHDVNMTIYSDPEMTNVVDISGFTLSLRLITADFNGRLITTINSGLTGSSAGLFVWKPSNSSTIQRAGLLKVRPRFTDSTQRLTAIGVNASDELLIKRE